ncbi:MAG: helix-turn-helix domain-containing protein [Chloroflexota bacterium]|nr:helix-turn-helix domain-containing protein [Chloroflexota bacterium]
MLPWSIALPSAVGELAVSLPLPAVAVASAPAPAPHWPAAKLLQQHRLAAGLSQPALAAAAGLSRTTVSNLENGDHPNPHYRSLAALANTLHLDLAALLTGDEPSSAWSGAPYPLQWAGSTLLQTCRAGQGLTLTALHTRTGLGYDLLRAIERGPVGISYATLVQLAAGLNIDVRQLISSTHPAPVAQAAASHPAEPTVWTIAEAMAYTGMNANQIYKLIERGQIGNSWRGKTRVVVANEIYAWRIRHDQDRRGRRALCAA